MWLSHFPVGVTTLRTCLQHTRQMANSNEANWSAARETVGQALREKAGWVHDRLKLADSNSVPMSEETVTETLLLDLRLTLGAHLEVDAFTKYQESHRTGADWEWWFSDGVGQRMFGMRVQAKKLKIKSGTPYYDFAYKPKLSSLRQVDRLIAAADRDGIPAVYAMYNGPELDLSSFIWVCCNELPSDGVFGVSLLSAEAARRLADQGNTSLAQVGALSRPWSCAALCPTNLRLDEASPFWPEGGPDSIGLYAADLVTELLSQEAEPRRESTRQQALRAARGFRSWDEAPDYVRELVARAGIPSEERIDLVPSRVPRDLGGVAVFVAALEGQEPDRTG